MPVPALARYAPFLFVLLWSAGFIGAKYGLPYAPPFSFLAIRFAAAALILLLLAVAGRVRWPRDARQWLHCAVAGLLVQAIYLGGVFGAFHFGVAAGVMALVAGLQPILVNVAAGLWLQESRHRRQWLGLGLGLAGVVLVVCERLAGGTLGMAGLASALLALAAISAGTVWQKRYGGQIDLRAGAAIQYAVSCLAILPLAALETRPILWNAHFVGALVWLTLGVSIGAICILLWLIRRGEAGQVSSYFFLVPPTTAAMAWLVFDEPFSLAMLAGSVLTGLGVRLVALRR